MSLHKTYSHSCLVVVSCHPSLELLRSNTPRSKQKAMKKEKIESETKWTYRIEKLESNQLSQDKKIAENEKEIADLKRFKCVNLTCNNRKQ